MPTTPKRPPPKSPAPRARRPHGSTKARSRIPWPWVGLGVVVVLAGVVAVTVSGGSTKPSTVGLEVTRPVEVLGAPLARMAAGTGADPAVGQVIPSLSGTTFDGQPIAIGPDGRPKLVVFVAHWCPHCQREVPILVDHLVDNRLPVGLDLVTVATGTDPNRPNYPPSSWLKSVGWTAPTMADSPEATAAVALGLSAYPYFVAVDSRGRVVARTSGEITTDQFDQLVRLAAG